MHQLVGEFAVIGKQQNAFGEVIQAPDRIHARTIRRQQVHHCRSPLRIRDRRHVSLGLVHDQIHLLLGRMQHRAVYADLVCLHVGFGAEFRDHLAVDFYAPRGDELFGGAARRDSCGGDDLLQTLKCHYLSVVVCVSGEAAEPSPDAAAAVTARRRSYLPAMALRRTCTVSCKIPKASRNGRSFVRSSFAQCTPTSSVTKPRRSARNRSSGSNPQRSTSCNGNSASAARLENALNPHCVSLKPSPRIARISRLSPRPPIWRNHGWRIVCRLGSIQREPIATSQIPDSIVLNRLVQTSIGEERSASVINTMSPEACSIPCLTE